MQIGKQNLEIDSLKGNFVPNKKMLVENLTDQSETKMVLRD